MIVLPFLLGFVTCKLKEQESCHRVESPLKMFLAHVLSFIISFLFSYFFIEEFFQTILLKSGIIKNISSHTSCTHWHTPTFSKFSCFLLFFKFILELISKVIWFEAEASHDHFNCNHSFHDVNDYAEKYIEASMNGVLVLLLFMVNKKNIFLKFLFFISIGLIFYSYIFIWPEENFVKSKNYKKVFLSNWLQILIVLIIVIRESTYLEANSILKNFSIEALNYVYLTLVLTTNLFLNESIELIGCLYLTYMNIDKEEIPEKNIQSLFNFTKKLLSITFIVMLTHLIEHVGPLLYMHQSYYGAIVILVESGLLLLRHVNKMNKNILNLKLFKIQKNTN